MKIAALAVFFVVALTAQRKSKDDPVPPQTWPSSRIIPASCDVVWPVGLQVLIADGWAVKTSDRAGGLLILDRSRNEVLKSYKDFVIKYTTGKSTGFWTMYDNFRVGPAQVVAAAKDGGCEYSIAITYAAFGAQAAYQSKQWLSLPSNGFAEDKILGDIEEKLKK